MSLYSAPSVAITDEETELAATCSAGRPQVWFSDANADPRKDSSKSRGWSSLLEKAGGFVALNRVGKSLSWDEKRTWKHPLSIIFFLHVHVGTTHVD